MKKKSFFTILPFRQKNNISNSKTFLQQKINNAKSKQTFTLFGLIKNDMKKINKPQAKVIQTLQIKSQNQLKQIKGKSLNIRSFSYKRIQATQQQEKNQIKKNQNQNQCRISNELASRTVSCKKTPIVPIQNKRSSSNLRAVSAKVIAVRKRGQISKMNQELLFERRENYLNSKFNQRVNRLTVITTQNKRIYEKINSQRSHYSKNDIDKSYESNAQHSRRLSMSKVSRGSRVSVSSEKSISSSRYSINSRVSAKSTSNKNKQPIGFKQRLKGSNEVKEKAIQIQSQCINDLKKDQVEHFATLFSNHPLQNIRSKPRITSKIVKLSESKQNQVQLSGIGKSSDLRKNGYKDLQLPRMPQISQKDESIKEPLRKSSALRKRVLATIDQNVMETNLNRGKWLQNISEEPIKPKFSFNKNSLRI